MIWRTPSGLGIGRVHIAHGRPLFGGGLDLGIAGGHLPGLGGRSTGASRQGTLDQAVPTAGRQIGLGLPRRRETHGKGPAFWPPPPPRFIAPGGSPRRPRARAGLRLRSGHDRKVRPDHENGSFRPIGLTSRDDDAQDARVQAAARRGPASVIGIIGARQHRWSSRLLGRRRGASARLGGRFRRRRSKGRPR